MLRSGMRRWRFSVECSCITWICGRTSLRHGKGGRAPHASPSTMRRGPSAKSGLVRMFLLEWLQIIWVPLQAKGPTVARHTAASLFKNEDYFMQIDSHSKLVEGWDDRVIEMYKRWGR